MQMAVVLSGLLRCAKLRAPLQSDHYHPYAVTQFNAGRMPFLSPNQQCQNSIQWWRRRSLWNTSVKTDVPFQFS